MNLRRVLPALALSLLLSACLVPSKGVHVGGDDGLDAPIGKEVYMRAMPTPGNVQDAQNGKEIWFAYGAVTGDLLPANGVATGHYLENGTYVLGIQLNIAEPEEGAFYEAWLIGKTPKERVSLGHFVASTRPSKQTLRFEGKQDLRTYLNVAITREKDDGNPAPSDEVAAGVLRVTKR